MDTKQKNPGGGVYISSLYYGLCIPAAIVGITADTFLLIVVGNEVLRSDSFQNTAAILLGLAIYLSFPTAIAIYFVNLYPKIWVNSDGLTISYNHFSTLYITWDDVIKIQDNWHNKEGIRIYFKKGNIIHKFYGGYLRYAFWIDRKTPNLELLLNTIKHNGVKETRNK